MKMRYVVLQWLYGIRVLLMNEHDLWWCANCKYCDYKGTFCLKDALVEKSPTRTG